MDDRLLQHFAAVLSAKPNSKIVNQASDLGGRYWDRTSDLFGVNADLLYAHLLMSVTVWW